MRIHVNIHKKKNVEIMAPWSGVQILGRDSNGPIVTCMLNSLNSLPLDIDASLDVAGKKTQRIFKMCMETMTKLFVWFSFLLKNQLIMALWSGYLMLGRVTIGQRVNVHAFI